MTCQDTPVQSCQEKKVCSMVDKPVEKEIMEKKCTVVRSMIYRDIDIILFLMKFLASGESEAMPAYSQDGVHRHYCSRRVL